MHNKKIQTTYTVNIYFAVIFIFVPTISISSEIEAKTGKSHLLRLKFVKISNIIGKTIQQIERYFN